MSLRDAATAADILLKLVQTLAYALGAIWFLVNYVLNRTHVSRLQLELKTAVSENKDRDHLVAAIAVKNLGLSNVEISQKGSALVVYKLTGFEGLPDVGHPEWHFESMVNVLTERTSIEPGITVNEERLISLPTQPGAVFLLELRVVAPKRSWLGAVAHGPGRSWGTTKVVAAGAE